MLFSSFFLCGLWVHFRIPLPCWTFIDYCSHSYTTFCVSFCCIFISSLWMLGLFFFWTGLLHCFYTHLIESYLHLPHFQSIHIFFSSQSLSSPCSSMFSWPRLMYVCCTVGMYMLSLSPPLDVVDEHGFPFPRSLVRSVREQNNSEIKYTISKYAFIWIQRLSLHCSSLHQ